MFLIFKQNFFATLWLSYFSWKNITQLWNTATGFVDKKYFILEIVFKFSQLFGFDVITHTHTHDDKQTNPMI